MERYILEGFNGDRTDTPEGRLPNEILLSAVYEDGQAANGLKTENFTLVALWPEAKNAVIADADWIHDGGSTESKCLRRTRGSPASTSSGSLPSARFPRTRRTRGSTGGVNASRPSPFPKPGVANGLTEGLTDKETWRACQVVRIRGHCGDTQ